MATRREKIIAKAIEILKSNPDSIRYSVLVRKISQEFPEIPVNTIRGTVWNLETRVPNEVYKPARGLFRHVEFKEEEISEEEQKPPLEIEKIKEEDFYEPFADWLVNELEECTKAIALGGSRFRDKWGTPDVIGKREPRRSDIVKAPTEIVSAEIKADTRDLITAFGQACSYKLFSHKSYIVIPKNSSQDDISKLDALCLIFGIGLVLFDNSNPNDPQFEIRVRPLRHEPDMFYVNKYMKLIERELWG
ncbi:ATP-binding protein [Candidatus Methanoperedenaceae archaeon GB37]|nr:ATP-binding protein [Candidatus Methanoperedenaceae archaeon GB37]